MNGFESVTSRRHCGVEGVDKLLWVTQDFGAFGSEDDGPLSDWIHGSKHFMEHVKSFETVVTAGGNCGMYARFYRNYFKNVYTFEPDPLNFYCLDRNCVGEGYHKWQGALGSSAGTCTLQKSHVSNVGMHTISKEPGDVQMFTIDDLNLTSCGLIHLDVEGFEGEVLQGAKNTIGLFNPVIILEAGHGFAIAESMGYKAIKRLSMDVIFVKE